MAAHLDFLRRRVLFITLCIVFRLVTSRADPSDHEASPSEERTPHPEDMPEDSEVLPLDAFDVRTDDSPPAWMDEAYMKEQSELKEAAAKLDEEAKLAFEAAKKAAVFAAKAKLKAEQAHRRLQEDAAKQAASADSSDARKLAEEEIPSVTLMTFRRDSDLMPLDIMLPHQVAHSSIDGRERFEKVLVFNLPASQHHSKMRDASEFSKVPLRETGERDGADQVIQLARDSLNSTALFDTFLRSVGSFSAKTLNDLWRDGFMSSQSDGADLVDHHSSTAAALLSALKQCSTDFCAFMEPGSFVHRHETMKGWVDRAIDMLQADPNLVVAQAATKSPSEAGAECVTQKQADGSFNQRFFVIHRKRLQQHLPVNVDCAPRCDTFEAFFILPEGAVGSMTCGSTASWVIHPPDNELSLLGLFEGCAKASGREADLASMRTETQQALPFISKEHEKDESMIRMHRRLAASTFVGLPEFLEHLTSAHDFGGAETANVGEQMPESMRGWECPGAPRVDYQNMHLEM